MTKASSFMLWLYAAYSLIEPQPYTKKSSVITSTSQLETEPFDKMMHVLLDDIPSGAEEIAKVSKPIKNTKKDY